MTYKSLYDHIRCGIEDFEWLVAKITKTLNAPLYIFELEGAMRKGDRDRIEYFNDGQGRSSPGTLEEYRFDVELASSWAD
jgi:hypothetical protein